jgi:hypothetical protein
MALGKGIKQFIKTVTSKEAKKRNKEGVIGDLKSLIKQSKKTLKKH